MKRRPILRQRPCLWMLVGWESIVKADSTGSTHRSCNGCSCGICLNHASPLHQRAKTRKSFSSSCPRLSNLNGGHMMRRPSANVITTLRARFITVCQSRTPYCMGDAPSTVYCPRRDDATLPVWFDHPLSNYMLLAQFTCNSLFRTRGYTAVTFHGCLSKIRPNHHHLVRWRQRPSRRGIKTRARCLCFSARRVSSVSTLFRPLGGQDASNASGGEPQIDLANMSSSRLPCE